MEPRLSRLRLGGLIAFAARQWRRAIDTRLLHYDLTEAMWVPLLHLSRSAVPMRQRDLAAALSLDSSSVVRVLKQLEAMGLIERGAADRDRRAKALVVTAKGRALAGELEAISQRLEQEIVADLAAADLAAMRRGLETIGERLVALNGRTRAGKDGCGS